MKMANYVYVSMLFYKAFEHNRNFDNTKQGEARIIADIKDASKAYMRHGRKMTCENAMKSIEYVLVG